jgi:hypothetical protein
LDLWNYFSDDYAAAARRFVEGVERVRARRHDAELNALPITPKSPTGDGLAIHAAWVGPKGAPRVLVHSSGLHGPEGFAGSAVQLSLLDRLADGSLKIPDGMAFAFLHVVNPFGMAWIRLPNENNVDLNRNFLDEGQEYRGADPLYGELDPFMNPRTPEAGSPLMFKANMIRKVIQHGKAAVVQAFAGGQFEYPKGIKFGGRQLEEGPRSVLGWLDPRLQSVAAGFMIDVHTGVGPFAVDLLFVPDREGSPKFEALRRAFGKHVQSLDAEASGQAYKAHGAFIEGVAGRWSKARWTTIGQEFGTYSPLTGLAYLRAENAWTNWGESSGADAWRHPTRKAVLDYLRPGAKTWRWRIVRRGQQLTEQAIGWLEREAAAASG